MKKKSTKPIEGQAYELRLDDGRFAIGVISRVETARPRKPYGIFVYLFGPYPNSEGLIHHLGRLNTMSYVCRLNTSALDIYEGLWPLIGNLPNWDRNDWPFPDFYFQDDFTNKIFRRTLSEHDLITLLKQVPIDEAGNLEQDAGYGSEATRIKASMEMQALPSILE